MQSDRIAALALAITAAAGPGLAAAQEAGGNLIDLDRGALRQEIGSRYDAALALTRDAAVVGADNSRFLWASQAKAQCGIALGFLKSGTKDPVSVGKCVDAALRMQQAPAVVAVPEVPTVGTCNKGPYIVFFDWDRSDITAEAAPVLDNTVTAYRDCGSAPIAVAGYADRSGGDGYNQALSERRAEAVRAYLAARGIAAGSITAQGFGEANPRVPTADGVRELQNRRVEITVQ